MPVLNSSCLHPVTWWVSCSKGKELRYSSREDAALAYSYQSAHLLGNYHTLGQVTDGTDGCQADEEPQQRGGPLTMCRTWR